MMMKCETKERKRMRKKRNRRKKGKRIILSVK
jgi:hypothetical protein